MTERADGPGARFLIGGGVAVTRWHPDSAPVGTSSVARSLSGRPCVTEVREWGQHFFIMVLHQ